MDPRANWNGALRLWLLSCSVTEPRHRAKKRSLASHAISSKKHGYLQPLSHPDKRSFAGASSDWLSGARTPLTVSLGETTRRGFATPRIVIFRSIFRTSPAGMSLSNVSTRPKMSQSVTCASCVGQSRAVTLKRNPITLDSGDVGFYCYDVRVPCSIVRACLIVADVGLRLVRFPCHGSSSLAAAPAISDMASGPANAPSGTSFAITSDENKTTV